MLLQIEYSFIPFYSDDKHRSKLRQLCEVRVRGMSQALRLYRAQGGGTVIIVDSGLVISYEFIIKSFSNQINL